jgi:hypothetical protein
MIFQYIHLPTFLISFAIGIFFVYIYGYDKKKIYIYPSPENVEKILYKDKADNCFEYNEIPVECPNDFSLLSWIPFQK